MPHTAGSVFASPKGPWHSEDVLFHVPIWQLDSQLAPPTKNTHDTQMRMISASTRTNFSENCTYCRTNWVCYGRSQNNCSGEHGAYPAVNSLFVPARSQDRNSRQGGGKQGTNSSISGSICSDKGLLPSQQGCKTSLRVLMGGKIRGGSCLTTVLKFCDKLYRCKQN